MSEIDPPGTKYYLSGRVKSVEPYFGEHSATLGECYLEKHIPTEVDYVVDFIPDDIASRGLLGKKVRLEISEGRTVPTFEILDITGDM